MASNARFGAVLASALLVFATTHARAQEAPPAPTPAPAPTWNPAKEADPPLIPQHTPPPAPPLSTSGADVAPAGSSPPPPIVIEERAGAARDDEAMKTKLRELEMRAAINEARLKTLENDVGPLRHLKIQAYVQAQYRFQDFNDAASPNLVNGSLPTGVGPNDVIAKSDGTTTNRNLFRVRRARLRAIHETDVTRLFLQLDFAAVGGNAPGLGTIARNAEVTGIAHWTKELQTEVTAGLFMVPFRRELTEISMYRPFLERTWAVMNTFPNERDIGVHVNTLLPKKFAIDVGILNGQRLGETRFVALPDLNHSKDFYAAAEVTFAPVTLSVHGYAGKGVNVDPVLLRVKNFPRYGVNLGAVFAHTFAPKLGETRAIGELAFMQNMDTGVNYAFAVPAIPANITDDVTNKNERALYLRAEQDITRWALAGFRYDMYTTDSSIANNARDTYTLLAGARFSKLLRLMHEWSWSVDNIHATNAPAPSKHIFEFSVWLQGSIY